MWDFVKNAIVDSLDTVPDEYKGLYEQDKGTGKFGISSAAKPLVDGYIGLSNKVGQLTKTRSEDNAKDAARRAVLKSITDGLTELGIDLGDDEGKLGEVIKGKIGELVEANKSGKQNKIDLDKVKLDFEKRLATEKAKFDSELSVMNNSLTEHMLTASASMALAEAGTVDKGVELLMPLIHKAAKVIKTEDGKYGVRVIDGDGTVRLNAKAEPMSVKDLVGELKTAYPMAFKSDKQGGGGNQPGAGRTPPNGRTPQQRQQQAGGGNEMSANQKIAAGLAQGLLNK